MQSQVHFLMATTLMHLIPQKRKSIIKSSTKRESIREGQWYFLRGVVLGKGGQQHICFYIKSHQNRISTLSQIC